MSPRTLLAVDGNSLLHRAFHASARSGFRTSDGSPMWAVRGLLSQLVAAVDRVSADVVVVGFDDRTASVRRDRWPTYKAHRTPKPDTLHQQLDAAVDVLRGLGVHVVVPPGLEADDVLASVAAYAPTVGARTVVATSDRDSFALISEHTRMLRILNGGVDASPLLDAHRLEMVTGVRPDQYLDYAALRGDSSDNLPGVHGFGPKTAARLLTALDSARAAFADAATGGERCREAVGAALARTLATDTAREVWQLNCAAMTMVDDSDLGLDLEVGTGCLPLDEAAIRDTYQRFSLHVPTALRTLALQEPGQRAAAPRIEPRWIPAPAAPLRFPSLPRAEPAAEAAPAYVQEALF
jgi:5'-3' exonuclease